MGGKLREAPLFLEWGQAKGIGKVHYFGIGKFYYLRRGGKGEGSSIIFGMGGKLRESPLFMR